MRVQTTGAHLNKRLLVLLSGGLDSSTLLHWAVKLAAAENVTALAVSYGQKHVKEIAYARWHCEKLGVRLLEADLSSVFKYNINSSSLLTGSTKELETGSYSDQQADQALTSAYVPYRNGLFLSYAASVAIQLGCDMVAYGAHSDDATGTAAYPDCSAGFINHQAQSIKIGSGGLVELLAPFWTFTTDTVVSVGIACGMTKEDFDHTWSCYEGKDTPCNVCATCIDRNEALNAHNLM